MKRVFTKDKESKGQVMLSLHQKKRATICTMAPDECKSISQN